MSDTAVMDAGLSADLARCYDLDLLDDPGDLALYEALAARTGGPILELAAGSGRLAIPLAVAGYRVVAVDNDSAMLARAAAAWSRARGRRRTGSLDLVEADLTSVRLDERFALAFLALNSLLLLADAPAQAAALRTLAAHLAPGGLAVIDVFLPDADDLALYDGRILLEWQREDPQTGEIVTKLASARHDSATAIVSFTQMFDSTSAAGGPLRRVSRTDRMRLLGASELCRLAEDAGLVVEQLAGDHQMTPFGPGAERVVVVARLV